MMQVGDKSFSLFIDNATIEKRVQALASQISQDYQGKHPLFVGILNGCFMFAADLMKTITIPCEISFIKVSSYQATSSTGQLKELLGMKQSIEGRHVIIVEDIVDTGLTMSEIINSLEKKGPQSIEIATLLLKPDALQKNIHPRYIGFEIANRFVVGYGLDYNSLGRNLPDLYVLHE